MSQQNVEVVRRGYEAFNRDGPVALDEFLDPHAELRDANPDVGTAYGREAIKESMEALLSVVSEFSIEVERLIDAGDKVVASTWQRVRGKLGGVPIEGRWVHVWTLRNGRVVLWESYRELSEGLAAAGVDEERALDQ